MACKEGQFDVVELMVNDEFSINLNVQHVNGMTPLDLAVCTVIRYSGVTSTHFSLYFTSSLIRKLNSFIHSKPFAVMLNIQCSRF